jgi:hypothetical protein
VDGGILGSVLENRRAEKYAPQRILDCGGLPPLFFDEACFGAAYCARPVVDRGRAFPTSFQVARARLTHRTAGKSATIGGESLSRFSEKYRNARVKAFARRSFLKARLGAN